MKKISEMIDDDRSLAEGLKINGEAHQNYKMYTSMERALGFMLTGHMYLSNGQNWNDTSDRTLMKTRKAFARCFSASTTESIAMWMLYGDRRGEKGAMLNFTPSVMHAFTSLTEIELGKFENGKFECIHKLSKADRDYDLFLSDVVYTDYCEKGKVKITTAGESRTVDQSLLDNRHIFHKSYAWSYEKECRLVVTLSEKWIAIAEEKQLSQIRLSLPSKYLRRMDAKRLIRSPKYIDGAENGEKSAFYGKVDWKL